MDNTEREIRMLAVEYLSGKLSVVKGLLEYIDGSTSIEHIKKVLKEEQEHIILKMLQFNKNEVENG